MHTAGRCVISRRRRVILLARCWLIVNTVYNNKVGAGYWTTLLWVAGAGTKARTWVERTVKDNERGTNKGRGHPCSVSSRAALSPITVAQPPPHSWRSYRQARTHVSAQITPQQGGSGAAQSRGIDRAAASVCDCSCNVMPLLQAHVVTAVR